jgi:hypothetical protein
MPDSKRRARLMRYLYVLSPLPVYFVVWLWSASIGFQPAFMTQGWLMASLYCLIFAAVQLNTGKLAFEADVLGPALPVVFIAYGACLYWLPVYAGMPLIEALKTGLPRILGGWFLSHIAGLVAIALVGLLEPSERGPDAA